MGSKFCAASLYSAVYRDLLPQNHISADNSKKIYIIFHCKVFSSSLKQNGNLCSDFTTVEEELTCKRNLENNNFTTKARS